MNLLRILFICIAPVVSGVLLFLTFPVYDYGWLAWFGLIPLLISLQGRRPIAGFLLAFLSGLVFFAGVFDWILDVKGYEIHHHAILVPYLSIYFGMFGWIICLVGRRIKPFGTILISPLVWVSLEYIRSNLLFLGLPWALLGHSQYQFLPIIQCVSITGVYGLSFLIVLVNVSLVVGIMTFWRPHWLFSSRMVFPGKRQAMGIAASVLILFFAVLIFGQIMLAKTQGKDGVRISVLQANIEHYKRYNRKYDDYVMQTYVDLSISAAVEKPDLIAWPEAATPGFILKDMKLYNQVKSLIKETGAYYLIGSSEFPKFSKKPFDPKKSGNTALMFSPEGKVMGQYIKTRLVPFVEYIPYKGVIQWPQFIVPEGRRTQVVGDEFTLFDLKQHKFGVAICWESLYADIFRKFVKKGANFMVNISSESWFEKTIFQRQFLAMTIFRAVENRVTIARSGNNSYACFIDPKGRIRARVQESDEKPIMKGFLTEKVPFSNNKTFYTRMGDLFAYVNIAVTFLIIGLAVLRRQTSHSSE